MGWPIISKEYDSIYSKIYEYLKKQKGSFTIAIEKAKKGNKK